jgi:hypothetical protein
LAVASLVVSLLWLGGVGSLLAIIFSVIGRRQIRESNGSQTGRNLATAGLVIGIIGILGIAVSVLLVLSPLSNGRVAETTTVAACDSDARSVETALETYRTQNGVFPTPGAPSSIQALYSPLTHDTHGGPYLKEAPASRYYTILYDVLGHVWVEGPNAAIGGTYNQAQDINSNFDACKIAE